MTTALIIPAFIAGLLTFLAPCTLPLVPGYLGFISGVSLRDLSDPVKARKVRRKIFINGLFFVVGFSLVFITIGSLVGLIGGVLFAQYRELLSRLGGAFVILFGIIMIQSALVFYESKFPFLKTFRLPPVKILTSEHKLKASRAIMPGNALSSIVFGAAFGFGWTPCVGPVLGAILTLAATQAGVLEGALLLTVFSLGLGIPFLVLAGGIGYFSSRMGKLSRVLPIISLIGGIFIVFLGILIITNKLTLWINQFFQWLSFIGYDQLINYL